ncbi:hypothetical protein QA633_43665 [Bradyrhizobium barranii]|uniref:hypothetical protein n=1 Tax=Bradyrhizobium TaxID=374 RepID=UPI0024AF7305|nr:hypothetical protein [Bradyrhizobium barranii]WFT95072.1 hypothetical protein QA633_43665 [Bradyrhizobium barranii]
MIRNTLAAALATATMLGTAAAAQSATAAPAESQAADIDYKVVDPSDLFIGTRKYLDKSILLRKMRCYYADVDDYRCTASGPVFLAVFTATVEPASARAWIEKNCDQLKVAMTSDKCLFNPQFVYGAKDVNDDIVSGFQQRKVIHPPAGVTMIPSKAIKSER